MISGYFENEKCLEGLQLFLVMQNCLIHPDLMTITSLISACDLLGDMELGKNIHGYAITTNFITEVSVCNALIQMYVNAGKLEEADQIFARIVSKDLVSWTAMIWGYESGDMHSEAVDMYEKMKLDGVEPDEVTIGCALSAYASLGLLDNGIKIHEFARKRGFFSYPIVGNMLIYMYSRCKRIEKALEVFKKMREKNLITWCSMIYGYRINNKSFDALNLLRQMLEFDVQPNAVILLVFVCLF